MFMFICVYLYVYVYVIYIYMFVYACIGLCIRVGNDGNLVDAEHPKLKV